MKATTRSIKFASSASCIYGLTVSHNPPKKRRMRKGSLPQSAINTETIQEVQLKLSSPDEAEAMEKSPSESYPQTSLKEKTHNLLSESVTNNSVATTNKTLSQVKLIAESDQDLVGPFSDDSDEEDGDWDNAIMVDNETMNNFKKLFDVIDGLPPVQRR